MSVLPNRGAYPKKPVVILCYRTPLAILQHQMSYWFSKYPAGFYKFIEPCKHPLYKLGDSWTEEIGYSRPVFNKAFDAIGVRYKSKTEFMQASDKFQGKLYASYHDRKTNKTFFVCNSETTCSVNLSEIQTKKLDDKSVKKEQKPRVNLTSNPCSRNETKCHSYGGTIGGKNINGFTKITSSSLKMAEAKNTSIDTETKKIAEEMKKIWIEEIGELEVTLFTQKMINCLNKSFHEVFKGSFDSWRLYCRKIASSKFLMGEGRGNFKAWLTWAIKPESYERINAGEFTLGDRQRKEQIITFSPEQDGEIQTTLLNSSKHPLWIEIGVKILKRIGGHAFKQWFKEIDICSYQENEITIKAPSLFHRDYIERNYRFLLLQSLEDILGIKHLYLKYNL